MAVRTTGTGSVAYGDRIYENQGGSFFYLSGRSAGETCYNDLLGTCNYIRTYLHAFKGAYSMIFEGDGGGYFTNKVRQAMAQAIQQAIYKPGSIPGTGPMAWDSYNEVYEEWKTGAGYGQDFWKRTGNLAKNIIATDRSVKGQTITIRKGAKSPRIGYGLSSGAYDTEEIAARMEYGFRMTKGSGVEIGMPARPLFQPVLNWFVREKLPHLSETMERIIKKSFDKHVQAYTNKRKARGVSMDSGGANGGSLSEVIADTMAPDEDAIINAMDMGEEIINEFESVVPDDAPIEDQGFADIDAAAASGDWSKMLAKIAMQEKIRKAAREK